MLSGRIVKKKSGGVVWSGGSDGLLWLILHNDYKIGLNLKRFIFNEKNILIK